MTAFSPTDAALSGFRYIGRRPLVVLSWAGAFLAYGLIYNTVFVIFAGDKQAAIQALADVNRSDPEAAMAMVPSLSFIFLLTTLATLTMSSIMFTAAYRAFLRPDDNRFAYLRFGRDELRMAVLVVATAALDAGGLFLIAFVTGSLAGLGAALPIIVQMLYFPILVVGALCAMTWPSVRLSLAMPMTLGDHHLRLFESWKPTHGHFWGLVSTYLLSAILTLVVVVSEWAVVALLAAIVIVSSGLSLADLSGLFRADTSSLKAYFTVTTMIGLVLNALACAAGLTILTAPVANVYLALVGGPSPHHPPQALPAPPTEPMLEATSQAALESPEHVAHPQAAPVAAAAEPAEAAAPPEPVASEPEPAEEAPHETPPLPSDDH